MAVPDIHHIEVMIDELVEVKKKIKELYSYKNILDSDLTKALTIIKATKAYSADKTYLITLKNQSPNQRVHDPILIDDYISKVNQEMKLIGTEKEITIDSVGKLEITLSLTKINTLNKLGLLTEAKHKWFVEQPPIIELTDLTKQK